MARLIILSLLLLPALTSYSQQVLQLIGIEADQSDYSKDSYAVMYDNTDDEVYEGKYNPYHTIAVSRNGDEVKLLMQNYLIVPTAKGFRYITNSVKETPNDTTQAEFDFEKEYKIRESYTAPRVFKNKSEIKNYILSLDATFEDAILINYEKISFVSPDFYITEGFESEVHGGASWFNATEVSHLYKLNPDFAQSSNRLGDYISRKDLNNVIIDVVNKDYSEEDERPEEPVDENFLLGWSGTIGTHDEVYFSFLHINNRIKIIPYVLLNGNSHRSFLAAGTIFEDENILYKFGLKQYGEETAALLDFVSPDGTTRIHIDEGKIKVYDTSSGKVLEEKDFPKTGRIVMSEWALGKYTERWEKEF